MPYSSIEKFLELIMYHWQAILATDFHNFVKGDKFRHSMFSVLGSGVFNADSKRLLPSRHPTS